MIILDAYHHQRLGSELLRSAIQLAKNEKMEHILAYVLDENAGMLKICEKEGFVIALASDPHILQAVLTL